MRYTAQAASQEPLRRRINLAVVTICMNNPSDLERTCRSVAAQSMRPSRHIVIDGSQSQTQLRMQEIASRAGAEYFWEQPFGTYHAMQSGLARLHDSDLVLFLNATDRFAGSSSVQLILEAIEKAETFNGPFIWGLGRTVVTDSAQSHFLRLSTHPAKTQRMLGRGSIGLPHPSMVCRVQALRRVDVFSQTWKISHDYKAGLRLGRKYGPPRIFWFPVSFYDQHGESASHPVMTYLSKSAVRISHNTPVAIFQEPISLGWVIVRHMLRALGNSPMAPTLFQVFGWPMFEMKPNSHFCSSTNDSDWPQCCESFLTPEAG